MMELSRRRFLEGLSGAVPVAAMATLLPDGSAAAKSESLAGNAHIHLPHFAPRAKRAIQLFMSGAPSQMDLWDYKPGLVQMYDQDLPDSVRGNQALTSMTAGQTRFPIAPPYWKFAQYGQSGRHVSDLLPWTAKVVDELALVHTLNTDAINHEPAQLLMNTGNMVPGKASLGAWLSYGLGRMNENLPAFVVLNSKLLPHTNNQPISPKFWGSGFLSSEHAGVAFRSAGTPVLNLQDPAGIPRSGRRAFLDCVNAVNQETYERWRDPETLARISQYELAFRMQRSVPELTDLSTEPDSTWKLYGEEARKSGTFANNCLLARRMAERGVRFTQIYQRGWDVHGGAVKAQPILCAATDRACYALIVDLRRRGLLDDTLVIWNGEFGRTVYSQGGLSRTEYGRDHHPRCFTGWMAGGGSRAGSAYGQTDDFSYNVVKDPVHVRDFTATVLHLLGIDHNRMIFNSQGLDQKPTGVVPAKVVASLLA
ncbi:MAG TPA: DUF1501 domain-containing protein [Steroidobacteraceae bacterium]|nr:DUF1501 domain-containing protein [Steroidobacteraceae bacterium]